MASERESRQQSIWEHREPEGGPEQPAPAQPEAPGEPRLQAVNRQQMAWRAVDVEQLIAEDHPARAIWQLVGKLDLSSRARSAGQGLSRFWLDTSPSQLDGKWLPIPVSDFRAFAHCTKIVQEGISALCYALSPRSKRGITHREEFAKPETLRLLVACSAKN